MRFGWKKIGCPMMAVSMSACDGGGTGPDQNSANMILDFCAAEVPTFLAFQNDGGAWTRVTPDANGSFAFQAAPKLILAFVNRNVYSDGTDFHTQVLFTTTAELEPINNRTCKDHSGAKTLTGTVSNVPEGSIVEISMGSARDGISPPQNDYQLNEVPSGAVDLVAHRYMVTRTATTETTTPNRVIVRRLQDLPSSIPVLDFGASEAIEPASNVATVGGLRTGERNYLAVYFKAANANTATFHTLQTITFSSGSSGSYTIYGIPSTLTTAGDFHTLELIGVNGGFTASRGVRTHYMNPGDKSVTLGATLSVPTYSIAKTTPYIRWRAQLASQTDYNSLVSFYFHEGNTSGGINSWRMTATKGYFGGTAPATWDVTMPDLSGVSGLPSGAGLAGQSATPWAEASSGRPAGLFLNAPPTENETELWAFHLSSTGATLRADNARRQMFVRPSARLLHGRR